MENLGTHAQGVMEGLGTQGHDHEFLDVEVVGSVHAAVDDVHHGSGQHFGVDAAEIVVKGLAGVQRGNPGAGHGGTQNGVGAKVGLVVGVVEVNERIVDGDLVENIHADEGLGDFTVHMLDGVQHAFAAITLLVAVTELEGFAGTGGGTGRNRGAGDDSGLQRNFNFNGRVTAGIENLTAEN